jgi:5-methylcytosine-specific restriction endonuclease McrA
MNHQIQQAIKELNIKADFTLNSKLTHNTIKNHFKKIMIHLDKYECAECGNKGLYNGKVLDLQMDHINGIKKDQEFSNLRFLCPNCHSQTETYAGGNRKNKRLSHTA